MKASTTLGRSLQRLLIAGLLTGLLALNASAQPGPDGPGNRNGPGGTGPGFRPFGPDSPGGPDRDRDRQPPPGLSEEERQLLVLGRLLDMPEDRLDKLATAIERVRAMSDEEKAAVRDRLEQLRNEKRSELQQRRENWQEVPEQDRRKIGEMLRGLKPEERRNLFQELRDLSPEERQEKLLERASE